MKNKKVMKNLHILPTDKPSRLGYLTKKGKEVFKDLRLFDRLMPNILDSENQIIYITSDEEIKEGDWYCSPSGIISKHNGTEMLPDNWNKVILTTDQSLEFVQKIDDEFLEWFIKNPSCEEVEVNDWLDDNGNIAFGSKERYKIIIPKEELKAVLEHLKAIPKE